MANFNTHITVAAAGSLLATGICLQTAHLSQAEAAALFAMGTLAGLLPDIDSDHSLPAQWIFSLLSLATALLILFGWQGKLPLWQLLACAAAGAVVMRYIILKLFTRITVHRALFHSLPAALLAGLATIVLGQPTETGYDFVDVPANKKAALLGIRYMGGMPYVAVQEITTGHHSSEPLNFRETTLTELERLVQGLE